jgi:hypothetical protein
MSELFATYRKEKTLLTKVERGLEIQRKKVQGIVKEILATHGKGPHDIGDGRPGGYVVAQKGEACWLTPADKGGGRKKVEAGGEATPSTPPPDAPPEAA